MKHNDYGKRLLALLMCAATCIGLFGCSGNQTEKTVSASSVDYRKDGVYTTTVTLGGMSFKKGVDVDDITLTTYASEEYKMFNSIASENAVTTDETSESLIESSVTITSVNRKDDSSLEVSFVDAESENNVSGYIVKLAADSIGEKSDVTVCVSVSTGKNIACDTENVTPDTKTIKLTMTLENDNFASGVTTENITLAGSFENMAVASVSSAGKNLTLQLTGEIVYNKSSGCYTDGFVYIDKDGFENGYSDISVCIGVNDVSAAADPTTFAVKDGTASFDIKLYWDTFGENPSASDFTLDGAAVTAFEKKDDTTGTLYFTVDGKSTPNDIADAIFCKSLVIAKTALNGGYDLDVTVGISQASFYPVFDYAEINNKTCTITLKLYASGGTFAADLSENMISFADDFADAEISSLTRDSDTVSTLVLTVLSDSASVEEMNLFGTVILAEGSLICDWGGTSSKKENSRNYTYSEMGKALSDSDVQIIKGIVGGFGNTAFGTVGSLFSAGVSIGSGIYNVLEMVGVIESEKAKLDKIYNYLVDMRDEINASFNNVYEKFEEQNIKALAQQVGDFDLLLGRLETSLDLCEGRISSTAKPYNTQNPPPVTPLTYDKNGKCTSSEDVQLQWETYYRNYLIYTREHLNSDLAYTGNISKIVETLKDIQTMLTPSSLKKNDALLNFDTLCAKTYNFDAQSLTLRRNYRTAIQGYLVRAKMLLSSYYLGVDPADVDLYAQFNGQDGKGGDRKTAMTIIDECLAIINNNPAELEVNSHNRDTMYMYATGKRFKWGVYTISRTTYAEVFTNYAADLGFVNNESALKEFLKRMQGRTLREELQLLGDAVNPESVNPDEDRTLDLNPILLDNTVGNFEYWSNRPIIMDNNLYALCTVGYFTADIMKTYSTPETRYGKYLGYRGVYRRVEYLDKYEKWTWSDESDRKTQIAWMANFPGAAEDIQHAVVWDHYFDYGMYYLKPAEEYNF